MTELYSSKNNMHFARLKNGRTILLKSKKAQEQEKILDNLLKLNKHFWDSMIDGKNKKPLNVGFFIYRRTKRRWDWANIIQGISDAMVKAGYLEDDSAEFFTPVFLGFEVDKENPRVELSVL